MVTCRALPPGRNTRDRRFLLRARVSPQGIPPEVDEWPASKHVLAEMLLHPFVVVDCVNIALSEVRSDGDRGELFRVVLLQPVEGGEDHRARGASKQEPMFRETTAGANRVGLLDVDHLVDEGVVQ